MAFGLAGAWLSLAAGCGSSGESPGFTPIEGGVSNLDAAPEAAEPPDAHRDAMSPPDAGEPEVEAPARLGPPYPIVLAHGFFGFEDFAGVDFATYFYQVKDELAKHGEAHVYTPAVDPFNDSTTRGAQLARAIQGILDQTGYAKVVIIGHSQGGLDARVVAHDYPDQVAAVVTYATPHQGSKVSDLVLGLVSDPGLQGIADSLVRLLGGPLWDQAGEETSLIKGLAQFASPGIAEFNAEYPDAPGVAYFSIGGRTDLALASSECASPDAPPFIKDFERERDLVDLLLKPTNTLLDDGFSQTPNDGLVTVASAKHGTFLGCVPADHLDEIGQLFGDSPGLGNDWRHEPFFVSLVTWLRARGY